MTTICLFCERPFTPRQGTQQFCCRQHKAAFWEGCRKLGFDMFQTGAVNSAVIRMHSRNSGQAAVNGSPSAETSLRHEGEAN